MILQKLNLKILNLFFLKMIKILLLGHIYANSKNTNSNNTDENSYYINYAGLLFGTLNETKIGTSIVSNVIMKNLNLTSTGFTEYSLSV